MLTTLYYSIVNNEIKMPGQLENKVVVELTPSQKHHIAVLQGVNAHIALLKEYRFSKVIFDDCRSSDVVSTLFRCVCAINSPSLSWVIRAASMVQPFTKGLKMESCIRSSFVEIAMIVLSAF